MLLVGLICQRTPWGWGWREDITLKYIGVHMLKQNMWQKRCEQNKTKRGLFGGRMWNAHFEFGVLKCRLLTSKKKKCLIFRKSLLEDRACETTLSSYRSVVVGFIIFIACFFFSFLFFFFFFWWKAIFFFFFFFFFVEG